MISQQRDPPIRIIYLTRNPIDRRISNERHAAYNSQTTSNNELPAHCLIEDAECIKKHKNRSKKVIFPRRSKLIYFIRHALIEEAHVQEILANAGVKHIHVTYENLFHTNSKVEWVRLFKFLGLGLNDDLTVDMIRETSSMVSTSSQRHNETISNYRAVRHAMRHSRYRYLLH